MSLYSLENSKLVINIRDKKYSFDFIEEIRPINDEEGNIYLKKFSYEELVSYKSNKYEKELVTSLILDEDKFSIKDLRDLSNRLAFCKFQLENKIYNSGIYIWVLDNEIIYIGETKNFSKRFNHGYGNISRRNIFKGGQSTNCKMNRLVLKMASKKKYIKLYFKEINNMADYKALEKELIQEINPQYNKQNNI